MNSLKAMVLISGMAVASVLQAQVTLKAPPKGVTYRHAGEVDWNIDDFNGKKTLIGTTSEALCKEMATEPMSLFTAVAWEPGDDYVLIAVYCNSKDWQNIKLRPNKAQIKTGDDKIISFDMVYETDVETDTRLHCLETHKIILKLGKFVELLSEEKLVVRLGNLDVYLIEDVMNTLRHFASEIPKGENLGGYVLVDDPEILKQRQEMAARKEAEEKAEKKEMELRKELAAEEEELKLLEKKIRFAESKVKLAKRYLDLKRTDKAVDLLREVIEEYGDTPSAKDAKTLLENIED